MKSIAVYTSSKVSDNHPAFFQWRFSYFGNLNFGYS